jgi:hypothetical protein
MSSVEPFGRCDGGWGEARLLDDARGEGRYREKPNDDVDALGLRLKDSLKPHVSMEHVQDVLCVPTVQANRALGDHPPTVPLHRCGRPQRRAASRSTRGSTMLQPVHVRTDLTTSWTCPRHMLLCRLMRIAQAIIT